MKPGPMRVAEISTAAIRHNIARVRTVTGGRTVIAVVKANGYGHGAEIAARAAIAGGAELLGVTDLDEAFALREAGISERILCWLHGAHADFDAAVAQGIEVGVSHLAQLEALAAAAERHRMPALVQFKVDTGLSRNGAAAREWPQLFARAAELEAAGTVQVRGIFSHLANAGDAADRAQAAQFDLAIAALRRAGIEPQLVHLAASAAAFTSPHLHYNAVRVGVAIYGLSPFEGRTSAELGLIPAMTLKSEVVALRDAPEGTGVSYGHHHTVEDKTRLALVPLGYGDGVPRLLNMGERGDVPAPATVLIAGLPCPIVGRIGMDQCIVDIGHLDTKVSLGDPVMLFGDPETGAPPVEVWAERTGTINYEIVVGIGERVQRVVVDAASERDDEEPAARIEVADPEAMHEFGIRLGRELRAGDLVILTGPLGAGKTTLTRGIGEGLQVRGPITSPTFVLARTHPSLGDGPPLVHVDAYRLADAAEADDLDLDFEHSVVVAEWGAGLITESESWLELVIERPLGAEAAVAEAAAAGGSAETAAAAARAADDTEFEPVEPRVITVTGHGPRWREGVPR